MTKPIVLRGLTWGHRRAIAPLRAAAAAFTVDHPEIVIDWRSRTLQEFEHQPLADATRAVDLIVFDHPHLGTIVRDELLHPVDPALDRVVDGTMPAVYMGASLASYRLADATWAIPVDAATVHAVWRPDLLRHHGEVAPDRWEDAIAMMNRLRARGQFSILAARHHHALLTVASLMAAIGAPWAEAEGSIHLDRYALGEAIDMFDAALDATDRATSLASDAIDVHDRLADDGTMAYCPAAYGYATYGEVPDGPSGLQPHRLAFSQFPGPSGAPDGSVLGGAGVGMTAACSDPSAAARYLAYLASAHVQLNVFAHASGQPARREAWNDPATDARFGGFFTGVASSIETASMRPRFAGYSETEQALADILQAYLHRATDHRATIDHMIARAAAQAQPA